MDDFCEFTYDEMFENTFKIENFVLKLEILNKHMSKISFTNEAEEDICIPENVELNDAIKISNDFIDFFIISSHVKEYKLTRNGQTLFKIVHRPIVEGFAYIVPR